MSTREIYVLNQDEDEGYTPTNFEEAWCHLCLNEREKLREEIRKQLRDTINREVDRKTDRKRVSKDKRCIKCKWVFKKKSNETYIARNIVCGYNPISNVDFTEALLENTFYHLYILWTWYKMTGCRKKFSNIEKWM